MKLAVLVAYILMMFVVIFFTAKKNLSLNGFLLGGRNVGPWMSAFSYGASYFSAVIIVGWQCVDWRVAGMVAFGKTYTPHGGAFAGCHHAGFL